MTRFFDVFFSFCAIVVLLPFMIPIMIGLKLTGEHDIFYGQERIGKGGKTFKVWKFATMLRNSPNMPGGLYTEKNDPRILPMGRFLRKTKINELPQLLNILIGDMSIIGYRPLVEKEFREYKPEVKAVLAESRPGLSGIGSIVFRNEEEILHNFSTHENKDKFYFDYIMPFKGELECWYVRNKSAVLYWKLIGMTVKAVINGNSDWKKLKNIPQPSKELERYL